MAGHNTREDLAPLWTVGEALYREGVAVSTRSRWRIWAAAGLPAQPPGPGRRAAKCHAAAVERAVSLVDDAARLTAMVTEERNPPEEQARFEAEADLFDDARSALRAWLGWPQWGRPPR